MEFHVYLNDKKIGSLQAGETTAIKIEEGSYILRIKSGLFIRSNELKFTIALNETKKFVAEYFKKGFLKSFIQLKQL